MPFDGIVTMYEAQELSTLMLDGRVEKIYQPEKDEIIITVRSKSQNYKLLLCANASYPRIHLTGTNKENPAAPPVFCMLLRKHLTGGRILGIETHDYERIVSILIESTNELGDLNIKKLVIEIMGKHSNIILLNDESKIIDSIKHVDNEVSSIREVMPARLYVLPPLQEKTGIKDLNPSQLFDACISQDKPLDKYLLDNIKGFSPLLCKELCFRSGIEPKTAVNTITNKELGILIKELDAMRLDITNYAKDPCIIYKDSSFETPMDFHCISLNQNPYIKKYDSISVVLDTFYSEKDKIERLNQKKQDLVRITNTNIDRVKKKLAIQQDTLRDVADRDLLKLRGELLIANLYSIKENLESISLLNYYSENQEYITIPLDKNLTPQENAQRYFKKYAKAKSTHSYTEKQIHETLCELSYLESLQHNLENCKSLNDIAEIRQEMAEQKYVGEDRKKGFKKQSISSQPLCFISSDGFYIYVGKNNKQNDVLTLKTAQSKDIWLHTKNIPGSHVIVKKGQNDDVSDTALYEAAVLAAFHSKAKFSSNVAVDFTQVKNVKKPSGAKPGMVIYENYKTITVTPDEKIVEKLTKK